MLATPARKIRLLQLIDQLGPAGAEQLVLSYARGMDRSRFALHVCALRPWDQPEIVPALRALGVPVHELNQHHAYDLPILRTLIRYVRRERIDLIHTHLLASDVMGRLVGLATRRPVVSTIHNSRADLELEPRHRQWLERLTARLWCRRLIVVSDLLRPEIAAWFGVPAGRVVAIPNGVDTTRFRPRPDLDGALVRRNLVGCDGPLLVSIARLVPQKAQADLIEALVQVVACRPDVHLALVGDGPLRPALEAQTAALGVADRLVITGQRGDVPEILAAADAFVLSSRWEGMPVSLLEAMAAGCPAIATNVGGVGQLILPGQTGRLVPPGDPAALARAILECLTHPDATRAMADAARARITQEFSTTAMIRRWEALYTSVLRAPRSA